MEGEIHTVYINVQYEKFAGYLWRETEENLKNDELWWSGFSDVKKCYN